MKKLIILLALITFGSSYSQQIRPLSSFRTDDYTYTDEFHIKYYKDLSNYFLPFLGDWKYVNGDKTFIVTLWKRTKQPIGSGDEVKYYIDDIQGHYKMIQNYGLSNETVLYTSQVFINGTNVIWPAMDMEALYNYQAGGMIHDVTLPKTLDGSLTITINPSTTPLTAHWEVELIGDMFGIGENKTFNIPTNITLTKM